MTKPIIVLAGDYQQYVNYLREHGAVSACDRRYARGELPNMRGIEASEVVETGTFGWRKDAQELREMAQTRVR